jgi:hypothetical protein
MSECRPAAILYFGGIKFGLREQRAQKFVIIASPSLFASEASLPTIEVK